MSEGPQKLLHMWFNDRKNLLDQNGFYWDEARQMVIASDHAWDAYVKVHPMFIQSCLCSVIL